MAAAAPPSKVAIPWVVQKRQLSFLRACGLSHPFDGGGPRKPVAKMVGYGGAAGGGKSDALLMAGIVACLTYKGCRVGYFRRTFPQLEGPGGAIMRAYELLSGSLGTRAYNSQRKRWTFPNGAILQFCHLDREDDIYNYQSQQFDILLFDEATQFTWSQVQYMQTRIRASSAGIHTFTGMATNPGNIGHAWFKRGFVDAGEPEEPHMVEIEDGKFQSHLFIPSTLADNKVLEERDPTYRKNLENQSERIRRQLLEGDWTAVDGLAFSEWYEPAHVVSPFAIPDEWIKFRSLDWGFARPYACLWFAVDFDGRLYCYRELYGYGGKANTGTKEDPEDVAKKIMRLEQHDANLRYAVADDAVFGGKQDHSPSIAEQFAVAFGNKAIHWQPVGKGPGSRVAGKLEVHHRLKLPLKDGKWSGEPPMIQIFRNCQHTIRTLPSLVLDEDNLEDVETENQEDHCYDTLRYGCMSRPMIPKSEKPEKTRIQKHKEGLQNKTHLRRII